MYDYGARLYMPDVARWGVTDPLAEKYPSWSPYVDTLDNPINFIDPDGRSVYPPKDGLNYYVDNDGIFRWDSSKKMYEHYASSPDDPHVSNGFLGYYSVSKSEEVKLTDNTPISNGVTIDATSSTQVSTKASTPVVKRNETADAIVNHPATSATMAGVGAATARTSSKIIQSVNRAGSIGQELWWGPRAIGTFRTSTDIASNTARGLNIFGNVLGGIGIGFTGYQFLSGQITGKEAFWDTAFGVGSFWCPACGLIYFGGKTIYEQTTGRPLFEKPPGISNEITPIFGK